MRVVFLGNHTLGVRVLETISERANVAGVVAHPPDPEDGMRYESVFEFAQKKEWKTIRARGKDPVVLDFIAASQPDLLWITDFRYLIPAEILALAPLGTVNLHPSLLPKYRGRAPVNWAILNGETRLGLTAHFVDEGMDTGDIIEQVSYDLRDDQDVGDCLNVLYPLYREMTRNVLSHFESGRVPRIPQDHSQATAFSARKPSDGLIDWNQSARSVLNLVRAVALPYPGSFTFANADKLTIWKARIVSDTDNVAPPGCVVSSSAQEIHVQCGKGILALVKMEFPGESDKLAVGRHLGS